jgi:hypothetical protein
MTDTVVAFPKPSSPGVDQPVRETGVAMGGTQPGRVFFGTGGASAPCAVIEIDKLYSTTEGVGSDVVAALSLLADSIEVLGEARIADQKKDVVTADRYVQRFQANLPGLFALRKIGDGYGVIVNSLHFAFISQRGKPLSFEQLTTVWRVVRELRNAPFVLFERALDYVEELEKCGLKVDPPIISELLKGTEDE